MNRRNITFAFMVALAAAVSFAVPSMISWPVGLNVAEARQRSRSKSRTLPARTRSRKPLSDYTKFSHRTPQHRQACSSCHTAPTPNWMSVRAKGEAFPDVTDYPDHPSCVNCHRRQFFSGARPVICSICHTNVSPRDGARHPFENPKEAFFETVGPKSRQRGLSEFKLNFPHDTHQDVMAQYPQDDVEVSRGLYVLTSFRRQNDAKRIDSCSLCHQTYQPEGDSGERYVVKPPADLADGAFWLKKGTFKTTPASHASCFNCHWQDGGEKPLSSDCAGCHNLLPAALQQITSHARTDVDASAASKMNLNDRAILQAWLRRSVATFRHEETKHENVGCTACHINITGNGNLDARTLNVPLPACGGGGTGCHIKATIPKKILNIEVEKKRADTSFQCVKCHLNYGREAIPKSHLDAVSPLKTK
ncbi:MAG: hypothetical protein WCD76_10425 [Pyrinomonadaceae bacterium]